MCSTPMDLSLHQHSPKKTGMKKKSFDYLLKESKITIIIANSRGLTQSNAPSGTTRVAKGAPKSSLNLGDQNQA